LVTKVWQEAVGTLAQFYCSKLKVLLLALWRKIHPGAKIFCSDVMRDMPEGLFGWLSEFLKTKALEREIVITPSITVDGDINDAITINPESVDDQIVIHPEPIDDQIVIHQKKETEVSPAEIVIAVNQIEGAENPVEELVGILEDHPQFFSSAEAMERFVVSAESNRQAAALFMRTLRERTNAILEFRGGAHYDYVENKQQEYASLDLIDLAAEWQVPLALVVVGGNHYNLLLKQPAQFNGSWRALVYDPLIGNERYIDLPNWKQEGATVISAFNAGVACSNKVLEEIINGSYDLRLLGDESFAHNTSLGDAKSTRVQFDGYNCGPACLFMAALRAGAIPGWNGFKFAGREALERDVGLRVLTRKEILQKNS